MNEEVCCFTGHRKIAVPAQLLQRRTERMIGLLYEKGVRVFEAGGAIGFDTLAAQMVLGCKAKYPEIKLRLVLPYRSQAERWSVHDREIYEQIKSEADGVIYTSEGYHPGCMHMRNRRLVEDSRYCICYLEEETGGTAYTVRYARKKGLVIYNLADADCFEP